MIGKSVKTLQRWDVEGTFVAKRNLKQRRYYTHDQYLEYLGIRQKGDGKIVVYTRVSSSGQKEDLKNQRKALESYCAGKSYNVDEWIEEVASGLNYKRKKFCQLLEDVEMGKVSKIVIAHKDRFIRFGFEWFDAFAKRHNTKIEVMNHESLSPETEMTKDLLSIIHCFSLRLYGLRKYKKDLKSIVTAVEQI